MVITPPDSRIPSVAAAPAAARLALAAAVILGLLADTVIRAAGDGIGFTLWILAFVIAAIVLARRSGSDLDAESLAWLGSALLCAAAFAWRDAEELRLANVLGTLVSLGLFAMAVTGGPARSILVARVRDIFTAGVYTVRDLVIGAPMLVARDMELHRPLAREASTLGRLLRALLITVPLVLVFGALLSRADPVFASVFALPDFDVEWIVGHVMLTGVVAWWTAGFLRGSILRGSARPALPDGLPVRLGAGEITMALGAVIVLFAVFVAIQLRWLFGGADVVLATTGLTIAEYARRGFFELVTVTLLVLPLILVTHAAAGDDRTIRRHRQLSIALIVLLAAIIASALLRMRLYVEHFGLTADRVYATAFVVWLTIVAGALKATVLRGHPRPFAAIAIITGFATLAIMNIANPEALVVRVNLDRASRAAEVDYRYLARLDGDAAPAVAAALATAAPSNAACVAAKRMRLRWMRQDGPAWNLGARRGRAAVAETLTPTVVLRLCDPATAPAGAAR